MTRSRWLPLLAILVVPCLTGADWPEFRGTGGAATSADAGLPDHWDKSTNLLWKVKLPGQGASSPIVLGDRVYVTCYTGEPGKLVRHLVCVNRKDGEVVWTKDIRSNTPEAPYNGMMTQHGYASNTPATDGKQIYVFLGTAGVYAFDLAGNELWNRSVGKGTDQWGSGSSVRLFGDLVIVNAAIESSKVVALDKATGNEKWTFGVARRSWSTPAVVEAANGRQELVVSSEGRISGLDQSGKELWHCEGHRGYTCPSVIPGKGVAYVCGGGPQNMTQIAVRAGGSGDVNNTHVLWRERGGANVPTPVVYNGRLYGVLDRGVAFSVNAETGKSDYQQRLQASLEPEVLPVAYQPPPGGRGRRGMGRGGFPGGGFGGGLSFYASAVAADDKIFIPSRTSGVFVLAAGPEFKLLACNKFAGDDSRFDGTPAISDGQLFLRSNQYLYCVGAK
jgi:outer membrane protein assembly factor BamB